MYSSSIPTLLMTVALARGMPLPSSIVMISGMARNAFISTTLSEASRALSAPDRLCFAIDTTARLSSPIIRGMRAFAAPWQNEGTPGTTSVSYPLPLISRSRYMYVLYTAASPRTTMATSLPLSSIEHILSMAPLLHCSRTPSSGSILNNRGTTSFPETSTHSAAMPAAVPSSAGSLTG